MLTAEQMDDAYRERQRVAIEKATKTFAKAKIQELYSMKVTRTFIKFKPYAVVFPKLSKQKRDIIMRELNDEQLFDDDDTGEAREYYTGLKYHLVSVPPDLLPASSWESGLEHTVGHDRDPVKHLAIAMKIERSIAKNGYDKTKPVTIEVGVAKKPTAISYGNHRLQAVRNLMARGKLPPTFKIPVIVVFHDERLRTKIRAKHRNRTHLFH